MNDKHPVNSLELIKDLEFCVFDLETTGGNLKNDKIIEIGLVKIKNLEIIEKQNYLIQPEIKIPDFIQKLTNIKQADVEDSPVIEDVIEEILEFMGDRILVAHNTSFDVPFFNSVLRRLNKPELENKSLCTNLMTKYLIPNLLNSNLNYMAKIFQIKHSKAHRALDDASATAELLINYLRIFISKEIQKVNHLYYPRNRYELDRIHFKKERHENQQIIEKLQTLKVPCLLTLKGENGVILFSYPCSLYDQEIPFIEESIAKAPWETATIKLFGTFMQSFVNFNTLFNKIPAKERNQVMAHLSQTHLSKKKVNNELEETPSAKNADFIVFKHLVPEQYVIMPLQALNSKNQLVFRYPSHKKKLLQFIRSKANRLNNNKLKKTHFHQSLESFIDNFIEQEKEKDQEVLIFSKNLPLKFEDDFLKELEDYLSKNPSTYQYPRQYI